MKGSSQSQSKNIIFEETKKCLDGEKYQKECDSYILKSIDHHMYLQRICKSSLSFIDDKMKYSNNIESLPWK